MPGVNQLFSLIQALVICPLFTLQFGRRLKEYLFVLKSAGMWEHSREYGLWPERDYIHKTLTLKFCVCTSWAALLFHFVLCLEFYKALCVPVYASGPVKSPLIILEWVLNRQIQAVLPALVILSALQYLLFVLVAFAPGFTQWNSTFHWQTRGGERKALQVCSLPGREGKSGLMTQELPGCQNWAQTPQPHESSITAPWIVQIIPAQ